MYGEIPTQTILTKLAKTGSKKNCIQINNFFSPLMFLFIIDYIPYCASRYLLFKEKKKGRGLGRRIILWVSYFEKHRTFHQIVPARMIRRRHISKLTSRQEEQYQDKCGSNVQKIIDLFNLSQVPLILHTSRLKIESWRHACARYAVYTKNRERSILCYHNL